MKRFTLILLAVLAGVGATLGSMMGLKYTSTTAFCLSCHSMSIPYEEYQGSIHFTNAKGIRAECQDCHIPQDSVAYLITKLKASKDIYHEFVTGKISDEDKYEAHRLEMAENVWRSMRGNDSATCRSCHSFSAMDTFEQKEESVQMHEYARDKALTCIDCHKGVAHFAPQPELDTQAFDELLAQTSATSSDAQFVYPPLPIELTGLGTVRPATQLKVLDFADGNREVEVKGYQLRGAEKLVYKEVGKRILIATLTPDGQEAVTAGEFVADEYGNEWRPVRFQFKTQSQLLSSQQPIWTFAETLDKVYCGTCHAIIPAHHFTANAWGPVNKGMGERTDISSQNLELLTLYFQYHAKDVKH